MGEGGGGVVGRGGGMRGGGLSRLVVGLSSVLALDVKTVSADFRTSVVFLFMI